MIPDGPESGFVYDIGQFCARCAGGHAGHFIVIDGRSSSDLLGMDFQYFFTALEIREGYGHLTVETARAGEGRIQGFRTVRSCQDDDPCIFFKSVHFGQKLVQGLFSFIIAPDGSSPSLLANSIDFIDEYDAGRFFFGLFEKVTDFGRTHADEHFHKFGTGNGEEGNSRFTGYRFSQHGFTGARRSYEKDAFRHFRAYIFVLARIMKVGNHFFQGIFCFIFPGNICKFDTIGRFHINLCVRFPHAELHGSLAAHTVHNPFIHVMADAEEDKNRQDPGEGKVQERIHGSHDFAGEIRIGFVQPFHELGVIDGCRLVGLFFPFLRENDLVLFDLDLVNLLLLGEGHEIGVIHFLHRIFLAPENRPEPGVDGNNDQEYDEIVRQYRFLRWFEFFHLTSPLSEFSTPCRKKVSQ